VGSTWFEFRGEAVMLAWSGKLARLISHSWALFVKKILPVVNFFCPQSTLREMGSPVRF
jgi:hypothetical protein